MPIEPTSFKPGEHLFHEGAESKSLYLIKVGRVSIQKAVKGGTVEIAQVGANQIIGEVGFFDQRPRSGDAIALSYCEVIEIPYDSLRPLFDPAPDYLKKIVIALASRLREADETIRLLKEKLGEGNLAAPSQVEEEEVGNESETQKILRMTEE